MHRSGLRKLLLGGWLLIIGWTSSIQAVPLWDEGGIPSHPEAIAESQDVQLWQQAHAITVKLWVADNNWGSGILINQQGQTYTVLTNRHVLTAGTTYQVQTADGRIYSAIALYPPDLANQDIGLVQFTSSTAYSLAELSASSLAIGEPVMAAGYPIDDDPSQPPGFAAVSGQIALLIPQTMAGGYQIGADIAIAKGMSGGPLLNMQGQVVGMNGLHQYPLWGNPYVFDDGSLPSLSLQDYMQHYSWSIPTQIILPLLD